MKQGAASKVEGKIVEVGSMDNVEGLIPSLEGVITIINSDILHGSAQINQVQVLMVERGLN